MRVMRGHKVSEAVWLINAKRVLTRGWWLGIRHECARGRVFKPMLRVFFVSERELLTNRTYKHRHALQTSTCRHCQTVLYVHAQGPEYEAMRTEAAMLGRLGVSQLQYVDDSTTLTPLGVGASGQVRRIVR